jgi:hypothetical protein
MPQAVSRRIVERNADNEVVVVVSRNGRPARVFGYDEYKKMKEQPQKVKPWLHRKAQTSSPDPLGAVEGSVTRTIRRSAIYD